jgi:hypothetical protein
MDLKVEIDDQLLIIDRIKNENYLVYCAALSFHKSLVGISELNALEMLNSNPNGGGLRISRAMSSYYSIYHLFICMILLDKEYILKVRMITATQMYH